MFPCIIQQEWFQSLIGILQTQSYKKQEKQERGFQSLIGILQTESSKKRIHTIT